MRLRTSGRVRGNVLLGCLFVFLLWAGSPRAQIPCAAFFAHFLPPFSEPPFLTTIGAKKSQNGSLKTPQNHKKPPKHHPPNAPALKTSKKAPSGGAKPSKLMTLTHFELFFPRPGALKKESKWKPKWSLRAPKISKSC